MRLRGEQAILAQEIENLPGFDERLARDSAAADWLAEQMRKVNAAIKDDDAILFERALGSWVKACERVNELVAEEYRQANLDPATWELRYLKWMSHVTFIRFESPLGEFFVVPRKPKKTPKAKHWYTADEMIDMMTPVTRAALMAFQALPVRPETLTPAVPGEGEKHLHIDFTGTREEQVTFDFKGGVDRGRKGLC